MLPVAPSQIDESLLGSVCSGHWPESQTLDFKRELPGNATRDRHEFLKDVSGMANADGGDLVYGIAERDGTAESLSPIVGQNLDEAKRRFTQLINDCIEPRITGVTLTDVQLSGGGAALVIRVPASFDMPHRYRLENGNTRFVVRNGTVNIDMTYDQIRSAFDRSATMGERARRFREDRCAAIAGGLGWRPITTGPLAVVHLIPLAAFSGRASIDVGSLHDGEYMGFAQPGWFGVTTRTLNIHGLAIHPSAEPGAALNAYTLVFRTGCVETVRNVGHLYEGVDVIASTSLATFVRHMTIALIKQVLQHGYPGPAVLGVSLLHVGGVKLGLGERYQQYVAPRSDLVERDILAPETLVAALSGVADPDAVVRPILDMLWQCFDEPRCREYDTAGRWVGPSPT
jgi:hypothetical protein